MAEDKAAPIFKKVKKVSGHAAHGGVWKLAYADFVTAMMAFFLLMWLLNVTSEEMKSGLAQYFTPEAVSPSTSGGGDVFFGLTISVDTPMEAQSAGSAAIIPLPEANRAGQGGKDRTSNPGSGEAASGQADSGETAAGGNTTEQAQASEAEAREISARLQAAAEQQNVSDKMITGMSVTATADGVLVEIGDTPNSAMFEIGSTKPVAEAARFLEAISEVLKARTEPIVIVGHTDGRAYPTAGYTNWELSSERANAARRVLASKGVPSSRITRVIAQADQQLKNQADPLAPENRRIQFLLKTANQQETSP